MKLIGLTAAAVALMMAAPLAADDRRGWDRGGSDRGGKAERHHDMRGRGGPDHGWREDRGDRGRWDRAWDGRPDRDIYDRRWRETRRSDGRDDGRIYRDGYRDGYHAGRRDDRSPHRRWRAGERLPPAAYPVVADWRSHGYGPPRRGQTYLRVDNDVLLVVAATGLILDVMAR